MSGRTNGKAPPPSRAMAEKLRLSASEEDVVARISLLFARSPTRRAEPSTASTPEARAERALRVGTDGPTSVSQRGILSRLRVSAEQPAEPPRLRVFRGVLDKRLGVLDRVLDGCRAIREGVEELEDHYEEVTSKTSRVDTDCQTLLKEQESLARSAGELRRTLQFFNEAHHIASRLRTNDLAQSIANSPELHGVLQRLDKCIEFMKSHSEWTEAQRYLVVFKRLQEKVVAAVKSSFVAQLRAAAARVRGKLPAGPETDAAMASAKAFVEFQTVSSQLRPLIVSLQDRAPRSEPYSILTRNLYAIFAQQRVQLLRRGVAAKWRKEVSGKALPEATRAGGVYVVSMLSFEYQLFEHFFKLTDPAKRALAGLLGSLAGVLYRGLRPLVLAETDMAPLSQAIRVLTREILEQQIAPRGDAIAPAVPVVKRLLTDMQLRLAFRARAFIADRIGGFQPQPRDLDYPSRLKMPGGDAKDEKNASGEGKNASVLPAESAGWYPPLSRTLQCLSRLHKCVEEGAFGHIAQEAIAKCTTALRDASRRIESSKGPIDAQLFLVKHLLILRSQISVFSISRHLQNQLDFSHMGGVLSNLIARRSSLASALADTAPTIIQKEVDAKKMLENQLRATCEQLITQRSDAMVGDLAYLLQAIEKEKESTRAEKDDAEKNDDSKDTTASSKPATPETLAKVMAVVQKMLPVAPEPKTEGSAVAAQGLAAQLKALREGLRVYLASATMESMLFDPVLQNTKRVLRSLRVFAQGSAPDAKELNSALLSLESATLLSQGMAEGKDQAASTSDKAVSATGATSAGPK